MIRTQIQLTEEQARRLRAVSRREGISLAESIRRCIDQTMASSSESVVDLYARAARLVGAFQDSTGATDVAEKHDTYLEQAYQ